ncbi:MAG: PQQ-binding-like beta-propeller repeat protein [Planctomycetes bacterium]|nr:PQQ-binding-like beta-propeller repeat protein [Planctomycetota bacterium]
MGRIGFYGFVLAVSATLLGYWLLMPAGPEIQARVRIPENHPSANTARAKNVNQGTLIPGKGTPSSEKGSWPRFRGPAGDAIATGARIASTWPADGPKVLWKIDLGEGHAGAAVHNGCVYIIDYDEKKNEDAVRCLSLDSAEEIWRYTYYVKVKRNHGMSRTVPAVTDKFVVTLGPKCHVVCLDATTGEAIWKKDLVADYGTRVPEWYAGQCPLIDGDRAILAPGGACLMTAVELATGKTVWETPNPKNWQMTHSSILPIHFGGKRQYVWCASDGVIGVDAETGKLLWEFPDWRIRIATVPTPVDVGDGRLFFTGGYNAGSMMVQLVKSGDAFQVKELFRTKPDTFGSDQQTPILHNGLIYGVIPGGRLTCLSLEGKQLWIDKDHNFGLGPYLMVNGKLLVLDDQPPVLYLFDVNAKGAKERAHHSVIGGYDAWAPIAFVNGKVLLRDAETMVCLDLR